MHAVRTVLHKEIVTGATRRTESVLKDPLVVSWKETSGTITVDRNTARIPPRTTNQAWTGTEPSVPQISIGRQKIEGTRRSIITQEVRNSKPLDRSINIITARHRDPNPGLSKVIGSKSVNNESANVYAHSWMNFGSDTVLSKSPNFMDFGLLSVNTTDELMSVFVPTTIIGRPMDGSNWLPPRRGISKATVDRVSRTEANNHYNFKSEFETRRDKMLDQDFGRQNDPMGLPTVESTPLGTYTTNETTSPMDSIPFGTKNPDPTPLKRPTYFTEENGKAHVPGDLDPDPSLSDSSPKKSNSSNDSNSSKSKKKKRNKK